MESAQFRQLVIDFRREHPGFPITVIKAGRWAQGDYEEKIQKQFSEKLRAIAKKTICADDAPAASEGEELRVISREAVSKPGVDLAESSAVIRRSNLVSLRRAREMLQSQLPREQHATASYLAGFLETNAAYDADLTRRLREQRAESMFVFHTFDEGQLIIRRGEKVDAKIKMALDALNVRPPATVTGINPWRQRGLWVAAGFFLAMAIFIFGRSLLRAGGSAASAHNVVVLPRVGEEGQILEARLMPHLARALMNKLVRGLISQRARLLTTQTSGTEQLNELEQQLEQISTRLQVRQASYEKRIEELESELAAAEEENRELIRAKIREARENLELAKAQAGKS